MATNCSWCGKKIGFFDITYTCETVDDKEYFLCGECTGKVSAAKNRTVSFEKIRTSNTSQELFDYLNDQVDPSEERRQEIKARQEQAQRKEEARRSDPLYEDIHQIATDLRFIKNYLIVTIVAGLILGFIWLLSIM